MTLQRIVLKCLSALGLITFLGGIGHAQTARMEDQFSIPLQGENYTIPFVYRTDRAGSPVQIYNINSKYMVISSLGFGLVCSIATKLPVGVMQYPRDFLLNEGFYVVAENQLATAAISPELSRIDTDKFLISGHVGFGSQKVAFGYPFILRSTAFFYDRNGEVVGIDQDKKLLSNREAKATLLRWLETTPYSDIARKTRHRDLITSGRFLIVDGIFYTSDLGLSEKYFTQMGIDWTFQSRSSNLIADYFISSNSDAICGVAMNGDTYFQVRDGIMVIDQNGVNVGNISMERVDQRITRSSFSRKDEGEKYSPAFYNLLPNGTLYAMTAFPGDKAYFYSGTKNWGTDYVGLSRSGISAADQEKTRKILQSLNNQELRIIRNAFFATQGYDFQSWDLKTYFNGYDWYQPKPGVKSDPATLNTDQKRLFDLVVAEEARRK